MNSRIKANYAGALDVPVPDTFGIIRDLTGIVTCVVSKRAFWTSLVVHLWFPMHICRGIELADLKLWTAVGAKPTHRPIHDVARNTLNSIHEIYIFLSVEWAIIDLAVPDIGIIKPLFN